MEKDRVSRVIAIIALVVAVAGLSLGFAVFSTSLTITPTADVKPDAGTFKVVFTTQEGEAQDGTVTADKPMALGVTAEDATIAGTTITNLKAHFTAPGQSVSYSLHAYSDGAYVAYLDSITYTKSSYVCTPKSDGNPGTENQVTAACGSFTVSVTVGDSGESQVTTDKTKNAISGHSLAVKASEDVKVTITYTEGGAVADGDFDVEFGDITLGYKSTPNA